MSPIDSTLGIMKRRHIANISPTEPTDTKGNANPPKLYRCAPMIGPKGPNLMIWVLGR